MKNNKHEKIISVAGNLISNKGYKGVSLQEIGDKVGLDKSTIFHYFKNKETLLLRVLEKSVDEVNINLLRIVDDPELEPEEKLEKAINNHLVLLVEYFDNVNVYLNELRNLSKKYQAVYLRKRKKYEKDFEKIIIELKEKGYFDELDTKIIAYGLLGMLNWVTKWYRKEGPLSIEQISNIFNRIVFPK